MQLQKCANCGGQWFAVEQQYTLNDLVFDVDGDPALDDNRYIYRCGNCREVHDITTFDSGLVRDVNTP